MIDPTTDIPFYVGKGCGNRLYKHEKDVKLNKVPNKTNYDLFYKIKNILLNGVAIKYEKVDYDLIEIDSLALEAACIEYYGLDNLCNYSISWSGSSTKSEKTLKRMSVSHKGEKSYMFGKPKTFEQKLKNKLSHIGSKNSRYDKTIYTFYNSELNLYEQDTRCNFRKKYNLDNSGLHYLIKNKRKSIKGWTISGRSLCDIEKDRRLKISIGNKNKPKSLSHRQNLWRNRIKTLK